MKESLPELERAITSLAETALVGVPASLKASILYSLLGAGKRIRPRMIIAIGDSLGLAREVSYRLGTALEMIHVYTLVHDDLPAMDDDDFRRGKPSNHKVYGEARAILAGDSLALLAFDLLTPLGSMVVIQSLLDASGARGVIAGQVAELELQERTSAELEDLFEVFRLKTGALFKAALLLPILLAGTPPDSALASNLRKLGEAIGIAFQIADDLEDDFGAKRSDRAHCAAYLSRAEAQLKAEEILGGAYSLIENRDPDLASCLAPFIRELAEKIARSGEP